ncbi:MAG: DNA polymerase III subunit gamma/tau [Patescibacteria group bacterium]
MSSQTLYRKYRPQRFADLIGQEHVTRTLQNEITRQQLSHAYLFSGPRGVGKTTTARLLAKTVNCAKPKAGEPDNTCENCKTIASNQALDILEIDAASYTGVDNIRDVIEQSRFAPSKLPYKVIIIDEVHMLSTAAFNALLKTLEEPPSHCIFILATTELHKVPETIQSRCQRFDFHRIADAALAKRLRGIAKAEDFQVDDEVIDAVVQAADGSSRDAESTLGQLFSMGEEHITREHADLVLPRSNVEAVASYLQMLLADGQHAAITHIQTQLQAGVDMEAFRLDALRLARTCLLALTLPTELKPVIPATLQSSLSKEHIPAVTRILEKLLMAEQYVQVSPIPSLPLEIATVELTSASTGANNLFGEPAATTPVPSTPKATKLVAPTPAPANPAPKMAVTKKTQSTGNVDQLWQQISVLVGESEASLSVSCKMVKPMHFDGKVFTLATPYAFHAERMSSPKAQAAFQKAATTVIGSPVILQVQHDANATLDTSAPTSQDTPMATIPTATPTKTANPDQLWDQIVKSASV